MARSKTQIIKSLEAFARTGDTQWDKAASLALETVEHSLEHNECSLVLQLDAILPNINGNIAKAFRRMISGITPIVIKTVEGKDSASISKNKTKKQRGDSEIAMHVEAIRVGGGLALKCWLKDRDDKTPKAKKAPTVARAINNAATIFESEKCDRDLADLTAAIAAIDALRAQLVKSVAEQVGVMNGVEPKADASGRAPATATTELLLASGH